MLPYNSEQREIENKILEKTAEDICRQNISCSVYNIIKLSWLWFG